MKKFTLSITMLFIISGNLLLAQQLYMPRNIKIAVEKGTRTLDGKPGKITGKTKGNTTLVLP